jgi:hypothetical protein
MSNIQLHNLANNFSEFHEELSEGKISREDGTWMVRRILDFMADWDADLIPEREEYEL